MWLPRNHIGHRSAWHRSPRGVAARDLASLSRRLLEISKELDGIEASEDGDEVTEAASTPDEPYTG